MRTIKWYNEDSDAFMRRDESYLRKNETIQGRIEDIAKRAFKHIYPNEAYYEAFINYLYEGYISLSTPVWANFGREGFLSISCFGGRVPDSMDGIAYSNAEAAMEGKYGGGLSYYMGDLRPRGSKISKGGESEGSVHFMKWFEATTKASHQAGTRRGSMSVTLPIDHNDIDEFITIRNEDHEIQDLFPSVSVTNEWMESMINGDVDKRRVWAKVLTSRQRVGTPFIFFKDNVNDNKPQVYKDKGLDIFASNLCVAPYTKILTSNGYIPIGDLENEEVEVWNGNRFSKVIVKKTGSNQKLVRVKTDSGYELDCTPYHKFYIQRGYNRGTDPNKLEIVEKRAFELEQGDKLIKFDLPLIDGDEELKDAYINGFYTGDGCLAPEGQRIYLYGDKRKLRHRFDFGNNWIVQDKFDREYCHFKHLKDKFFVPSSNYSIRSRIEWLSGYIDADGVITDNNGSQSLQVTSINIEFLKELQLMLQTLGCDSKIKPFYEEGFRKLPKNDGSGEYGDYWCNNSYILLVNGNSLYKLTELGLNCERLEWKLFQPNRECSRFIKVESVEELKDTSDTYCFNEPIEHKGMFNGILTGQCMEIGLPSAHDESFVCCLASLNAEKYDEWKDTNVVEVLTAFLDTVLTDFINTAENIKFLERTVKFSKRHRAIGIGVLGFHSYLQKNMIPFESMGAKMFNVELFSTIKKRSYEESIRLGEELGYAPIFEEGGYNGVKMRNTTTMAVAPTSSSAFILGQLSQGIEPYRSNYYTRDMAKGKKAYKNPYLEKIIEERGRNTEDVWDSIGLNHGSVQHLDFLTEDEKDVFKTFSEISQTEIINLAAQRQKYIDQAQSLNIMLHPSTPAHVINELILHAWRSGIKTLYYNHNISGIREYVNNTLCKNCEA